MKSSQETLKLAMAFCNKLGIDEGRWKIPEEAKQYLEFAEKPLWETVWNQHNGWWDFKCNYCGAKKPMSSTAFEGSHQEGVVVGMSPATVQEALAFQEKHKACKHKIR